MITFILVLSVLGLGAMVIPDPANTQEFIETAFGAWNTANYRYLAAMAIIMVVFLLRKYGKKLMPFIEHGRWAWATAVALGALGALGAALAGDTPPKTVMAILATLAAGAFTGAGAAGIVKGASEWTAKKPPAA